MGKSDFQKFKGGGGEDFSERGAISIILWGTWPGEKVEKLRGRRSHRVGTLWFREYHDIAYKF